MCSLIRAKRIQREIELVKKEQENLNATGIYFWFNENDISEMRILINPHQSKSAYDGGFFIFEVDFPENFPMEPPKVTFNPKQNTVRFHPNYYQNGKVCLSIINTWGVKQWASSLTMVALANTLISRMDENAITGEPGFENTTDTIKKNYNNYVEYGKYTEAIIKIMNNNLPVYQPFMEIIRANFIKQYNKEHLEKLKSEFDGKPVGTKNYGGIIIANYSKVCHDMAAIYERLTR